MQANLAQSQNEKLVKSRERLALTPAAVFAPTLRTYQESLPDPLPTDPVKLRRVLLNGLTTPFFDSYQETLRSIRERFEEQWRGRPDAVDKVASSVANSKKRSAGTNFQSLVSYALARYLLATNSAWYAAHPVPKDFTESLAISFTAGIPAQGDELASPLPADVDKVAEEIEEEELETDGTEPEDTPDDQAAAAALEASQTLATVNPDIDMRHLRRFTR